MAGDRKAFSPRVLITKIGLDGHDRGSRIVATYLRDAGMEVIYTAPWQTIDTVVGITIQEDIDVIGLSSLATDHLIIPELMTALKSQGLDAVRVVVGGIIPETEVQSLLDAGVSRIFSSGAMRKDIVNTIKVLALTAQQDKKQQWEST